MVTHEREREREMIHCSSSRFDGNEMKYVRDCLGRNWITQGHYVREFEERFAELCRTKYAIACSSGTAALHLAMLALGIDETSTVIVPALTYVATANAARYCGAKIVFTDVHRDTWCMDSADCKDLCERVAVTQFERRLVIVPVHLYDSLAEIDSLPKLIPVIEDACHAPGSFNNACNITRELRSEVATFSFYGGKVISCGEGGMVVTNREDTAARMRLYRGQGATIPGRYYHSVVGYNYRMTDLQAAIGLAQLERLSENLDYRRALRGRYIANLGNDDRITLQKGKNSSSWTFAILLPQDANRDVVAQLLLDARIETRPFFDIIPSLPPYGAYDTGGWPIAADVSSRGLLLPMHTDLTYLDVDYICEQLQRVLS